MLSENVVHYSGSIWKIRPFWEASRWHHSLRRRNQEANRYGEWGANLVLDISSLKYRWKQESGHEGSYRPCQGVYSKNYGSCGREEKWPFYCRKTTLILAWMALSYQWAGGCRNGEQVKRLKVVQIRLWWEIGCEQEEKVDNDNSLSSLSNWVLLPISNVTLWNPVDREHKNSDI